MSFYPLRYLWGLIIPSLIIAQGKDSTLVVTDHLIENLVSEPVINNEEFSVIDYLEDLKKEPININTADLTQLQIIPELDLNYSKLIIEHREKYGHFFSINELYTIKGLPKYIINDIKPFITISNSTIENVKTSPASPSLLKFDKVFFRSRYSVNLIDNNDTPYENYVGSKFKLYNKLTLQNKIGEAGIITEKDAGEKQFYDFISFHLLLKKISFIQNLVVGDYELKFGQGLVLWGPFGFSKSTDAVFPTKMRESKILPYNGTNESRFFRGIATSIGNNNLQLSLFYSNRRLDASRDSNSENISNLVTSGYHRTSSELLTRNILGEVILGCSGSYSYNESYHLGVLFYRSKYDKPFGSESIYAPQGDKFKYFSMSYESNVIPTIYISGEIAYDFNSIATINSFQISFNKNFLFVSSVRCYPSNFISQHGNSFSEQRNKVQNETGFYNGFKLLTKYGTLNFYYDQFKFPFGGYRFPISNAGEEFMLNYTNTIKDDVNIKIVYKYEDKDYLMDVEDQKSITRRGRNDIRIILSWNQSKEIGYKTSVEYNVIRLRENNIIEEGTLIGNSVLINLIDNMKITGGVCFFRTDSFYSSVFEYENNIQGLVRGKVLYGEGAKVSFYINYRILQVMNISAQYSEIIKPKEVLINPIYSTLASDLIFQIELIL
jgi:hypothetical protein